MKFDRGYISPFFVNETKARKCNYEKPLILLSEKKISTLQSIVPSLELAHRMQRPLLIVAEDVDAEVLSALVLNRLRNNLQVVAVKAPGFGDNRKNSLQDMGIKTRGYVFGSEGSDVKLDDIQPEHFGSADEVNITKDDTLILGGAGEGADVSARAEAIRDQIEETTSDYEREKLQERLARLVGGVAVVKVGGASDVEVGEKRDRVTDALNATRAAIEEGIVTGGGSALLRAIRAIENIETDNFDQEKGVEIIRRALRAPCTQIATNARAEPAVVIDRILTESVNDDTFGWDAYNVRGEAEHGAALREMR